MVNLVVFFRANGNYRSRCRGGSRLITVIWVRIRRFRRRVILDSLSRFALLDRRLLRFVDFVDLLLEFSATGAIFDVQRHAGTTEAGPCHAHDDPPSMKQKTRCENQHAMGLPSWLAIPWMTFSAGTGRQSMTVSGNCSPMKTSRPPPRKRVATGRQSAQLQHG